MLSKLDRLVLVTGNPEGTDTYIAADVLPRSSGGTALLGRIAIHKKDMEIVRRFIAEPELVRNSCQQLYPNGYNEPFRISPHHVMGGCNPLYISFVMPPALIQLLSKPENDDIELLATTGIIIAHEIGHLFDTGGSLYDEYGVIRDWWSPNTLARFTEITEQFEEYFGSFDLVPGQAQELATKMEIIADFAAMQIAFDLTQDRPEDLKKMLETFASVNWSTGTRDGILEAYSFEDHPAERIRCDALPACFEKFYEVYGIKEGDRMFVPEEKRLKLW